MSFELGEGVSFCKAGGHFIFLDIKRDRYCALAPDAAEHFGRLVAGEPLARSAEPALSGLVDEGLLHRAEGADPPSPCSPPPQPSRSIVEEEHDASVGTVSWALFRLAATTMAMRRSTLHGVIERLARRAARAGLGEPTEEDLVEIGAAFDRTRFIASPLDQCLERSIAAAHMFLDRTCRTQLVIGVRPRPFGAHCWLQSGRVLVNETIEQASNFTPILVL